MTRAADNHRQLDRRLGVAVDGDPGYALVRSGDRGKDARTLGGEAKVLFAELTECVSAKGRRYLRGWVGASNLVAFSEKPDAEGRPTWRLYIVERQPRPNKEAGARAGGSEAARPEKVPPSRA